MTRTWEKITIALLAALVVVNLDAAISISVTGSWSRTISQTDLQSQTAGSDLTAAYESATNQAVIGVSGATLLNWRVSVKRTDTSWNANFHLYVKRTGNGSGVGSISGGTAYQEITTSNVSFFTGSYNRSGINAQQKLDGVSCQIPAASYTTTIVYTVTQI